ncbi:hypothetical protein FE810_00640 [Thalassotalea litorea]|uniref:Uncharacterized protein n=1 Tax=Thalassotalea litorea TaxID=2020715 RepID=A0A5R9IWE5_9GAMM|nr:hypothetical protein [Thalassotalea litorea]TLU67496.1 hypothetical protein FE810_00640 [Thalassotalea litorea]
MIATFAHELAHYLTASAKQEPPGGWENWEFATDITATFLGFGVFMANSAFNFRQYTDSDSQGWQASRNGYLTEAEHVFSLALFIQLKGISPATVTPFLKSHLRKMLKKALAEIDSSNIVAQLKSVSSKQP